MQLNTHWNVHLRPLYCAHVRPQVPHIFPSQTDPHVVCQGAAPAVAGPDSAYPGVYAGRAAALAGRTGILRRAGGASGADCHGNSGDAGRALRFEPFTCGTDFVGRAVTRHAESNGSGNAATSANRPLCGGSGAGPAGHHGNTAATAATRPAGQRPRQHSAAGQRFRAGIRQTSAPTPLSCSRSTERPVQRPC